MVRALPRRLIAGLLLGTTLALLDAAAALPPAGERGRSLIRNFTPRDYASPGEIFGTVQAPDGRLFFAAQQVVLEYDGAGWKRHSFPAAYVHSIAIDDTGRIYVGGHDEIGWFEADAARTYHSLVDQVPAELKPLGFSRGIVVRPDGVYFGTKHAVLRWSGGRFRTWTFPATSQPQRLQACGGELFLHRPGEGLYRFEGSEFRLFSDAPGIREAGEVVLWPGPDGGRWIGSGAQLWRWREGRLEAFPSAADGVLQRAKISSGAILPDGRLAIGTLGEGVVVLSPDGARAERISLAEGLGDPAVLSLFVDRDGGLWAGTDGGMSRLDPNDGFTLFDAANGLRQAIINGIWRHDGRLYVSTLDGLLRLRPGDPAAGTAARFEPVSGIGRNPREMASDRDGLLIGTPAGLMCLDRQDRASIVVPTDELVLHPMWSRRSPDTLFLGGRDGVIVARHAAAGWSVLARFRGLGETRTLAEDADGALWAGTTTRGFQRLKRPAGDEDWAHATVTTYNEDNHRLIAEHGWVEVFPTVIGPVFSTDLGWMRYRPQTDDFTRDDRFPIDGRRIELLRPVESTPAGDLWAQGTNQPVGTEYPLGRFRPQPGGGYRWENAPHALWDIIGLSGAQVLYWEPDGGEGVLWVKGIDSLLRLEVARLKPRRARWRVLLKNVHRAGEPQGVTDGQVLPPLPWSEEPLRITYTSPRYDPGAGIRYRTRLRGFSNQWSEPSSRDEATFTNLSGGPFTFEVQATDAEGNTSEPARLTFSVTPPWPRRPVAYLVYGLAAAGVMAGFVRWRLRRSVREQHRLEALVARRTAELAAANNAKSLFLANMSHELRTPLNGILGYSQVLMKSPDVSVRDRERLRIVTQSGDHLLRMINEVLDFSKIEAGKLEARPSPFHLPQLLRDVAAGVEPRAAQKSLRFVLELAPDLPATVVGDAQKLQQVLDNLLGNAVKFTAAGAVTLRVARSGARTAFTVTDTGCGIAAEEQARIFEPFSQAVDGRPPEPGTGLGLAIAHRLVALMGGELVVTSAPGAGSTFRFALPMEVLALETPPDEPRASPVGYRGARRRLLIVDDVAINRAVLIELLAPLDFKLGEAADGAEALALVERFEPDLVFLDLRMPGIGGLELARRLRARPDGRRIKIVAMSASVISFKRDEALAAGCDDFLPKPFREAELIGMLSLHLGLEWRHAAPVDATAADALANGPAGAAELAALREIARRGEIQALRDQLAVLRHRHPDDARLHELATLAATYQMEGLRARLAAFAGTEVSS